MAWQVPTIEGGFESALTKLDLSAFKILRQNADAVQHHQASHNQCLAHHNAPFSTVLTIVPSPSRLHPGAV